MLAAQSVARCPGKEGSQITAGFLSSERISSRLHSPPRPGIESLFDRGEASERTAVGLALREPWERAPHSSKENWKTVPSLNWPCTVVVP
jgi:hypothetical protein